MNKASTYIQLLSDEISDDLRNHIDGDKLQLEVEKEVEKQILSGLVTAISEYNNCASWGEKNRLAMLRTKIKRNMEYVNELFQANKEITGILISGDSISTAEEIEA